ncbi:hypothetical protein CMEL01_07994 [Colletotrichum melonis]|uniref:Uncharacterized protein n=1 Tax=Colletotrichum melonis TaxID=1209925 RepID=A0AAI9XG07_9PEZI|nr:hypothetical protein CMEL01_07994 [Colletotrichum melonis]
MSMIHPEHPHDASLPPQNPRDALKPTYQVPETSRHTKERENLGSPGPQFYAYAQVGKRHVRTAYPPPVPSV